MEAFAIAATVVGSFATAFVIQKAALDAFFRALEAERRAKQ